MQNKSQNKAALKEANCRNTLVRKTAESFAQRRNVFPIDNFFGMETVLATLASSLSQLSTIGESLFAFHEEIPRNIK